jgi:hypothetical protein
MLQAQFSPIIIDTGQETSSIDDRYDVRYSGPARPAFLTNQTVSSSGSARASCSKKQFQQHLDQTISDDLARFAMAEGRMMNVIGKHQSTHGGELGE